MRILLAAPLAALACDPIGLDPSAFDASQADPELLGAGDAEVAAAMPGLSPEPLTDLLEAPRAQLGIDPLCPAPGSDAQDAKADTEAPLPADAALSEPGFASADLSPSDLAHEVWSADCQLSSDGLAADVELDGTLTWDRGPDGVTLVGDRAVLRRAGEVEFALDGAVELTELGDLLLLDVSATWCGLGGPRCDAGAFTVDLDYSLFPAFDYPQVYDVTVSGVVGTPESFVSVEGAWSIDQATCADEPVHGVLALRGAERHALELDGAEACDGCAAWAVQGLSTPGWCDLGL